MTFDWLLIACAIAVVASGLAAGVFMAFSDFLMASFGAARPSSGIEAMQMINRRVYKSVFVSILWSLVAVAPLLIVLAVMRGAGPAFGWIVAGGLSYLLGAFVVTFLFNVPMNKKLDVMDDSASETLAYWESTYLPSWTYWNSIRALMTMVSGICYLVAVILLARGG
jgi:uncharacterized membrane protein